MRSLNLPRDMRLISVVSTLMVVLIHWKEFLTSFSESFIYTAGVMVTTTAVAIICGLIVIASFAHFVLYPHQEESWGVNVALYLAFSVSTMMAASIAFTHGAPVPVIIIFSAFGINAAVSLFFWAGHAFTEKSWFKP